MDENYYIYAPWDAAVTAAAIAAAVATWAATAILPGSASSLNKEIKLFHYHNSQISLINLINYLKFIYTEKAKTLFLKKLF